MTGGIHIIKAISGKENRMKPDPPEIAFCFVLPAGLEPATFSFVARRSNPTELWELFFQN